VWGIGIESIPQGREYRKIGSTDRVRNIFRIGRTNREGTIE
jgi:hypothetical protein